MLSNSSPRYLHILQNLSLLLLSLIFLPVSNLILIVSFIIRPWASPSHSSSKLHSIRSSPTFKPRTILVTGVGMTKGLALARLFHASGHRVIGADFESPSHLVYVCGRFSRSVHRFYSLLKPDSSNPYRYIDDLLRIVKHERVDMWISCSGVASAVEDGEAKEAIERETDCRCVQFDVKSTSTFHEKHTFIAYIQSLGLPVPDTLELSSRQAMIKFFDQKQAELQKEQQKANAKPRRYIMKPIGVDDANRANLTLLPRSTPALTQQSLKHINPTPENSWIAQQFITGREFCTHSLVIRGRVAAFAACPSAELLMHYEALSTESALSRAMLAFTRKVAADGGESFTGHLSFDFLVEDEDLRPGKSEKEIILYPIECNPRAHTAVALFNHTPDLVKAYLTLLEPAGSSNSTSTKPVTPRTPPARYYWIGNDLVTCVVLPLVSLFSGVLSGNAGTSGSDVMDGLREFADHVARWRDGTWEVWDPVPFWWLYHAYWPARFLESLVGGVKWSRVNVSTGKMFVL